MDLMKSGVPPTCSMKVLVQVNTALKAAVVLRSARRLLGHRESHPHVTKDPVSPFANVGNGDSSQQAQCSTATLATVVAAVYLTPH